MIEQLRRDLQDKLHLRNPFVWWNTNPPWSVRAGNAVLLAVGEPISISTPAGDMQVVLYNNHLLQFRGGPWKADWTPAMIDQWAMVEGLTKLGLSKEILVIHENRGEMSLRTINVPADIHPQEAATKLLEDYFDGAE